MNKHSLQLTVIALLTYPLFFGTWLFYIAFMGIKTHRVILKEKMGLLWYMVYPIFWLALFMDVLFNFICGTMYYRERPKELLFTARCSRHLKGEGTQLARAHYACTYLLDPFDKGHCD